MKRKDYHKILHQWKKNELSLIDAVHKLVEIGFNPVQAFGILERT